MQQHKLSAVSRALTLALVIGSGVAQGDPISNDWVAQANGGDADGDITMDATIEQDAFLMARIAGNNAVILVTNDGHTDLELNQISTGDVGGSIKIDKEVTVASGGMLEASIAGNSALVQANGGTIDTTITQGNTGDVDGDVRIRSSAPIKGTASVGVSGNHATIQTRR